MIPAAFDYVAPVTVEEAVQRLAAAGEDAKILAGGHSLLPVMKLRLATPTLLIDLGRISDLSFIRKDGEAIEIGAMTTYAEIERSELIRQTIPMLAQASGLVGDAQVRHRGTIGGALVHADPAGDLPAVASALGGSVVATSLEGTRTVPITELFTSVFETVLDPAEVVTAVRFPVLPGVAQYYEKFRRRLCDWAIVGSAVSIRVEAGTVRSANVYLTNVGSTPTRARAVEEALVGAGIDEQALRKACDGAGDGLDPTPELNASAEYKKHLAGVITRRALENALASRPA